MDFAVCLDFIATACTPTPVVYVSASKVLDTEPPPGSFLKVPSSDCTVIKCQVEGGLAGWAIGKGNNSSNNYHQLWSTDAEEKEETIFSLKMTASFIGNYSELSVCGTEDMKKTVFSFACFAYDGLKKSNLSQPLTVEIYNSEVGP